MTDEIPDLPDWVKTLIDNARTDGFYEGRQEGMRFQYEQSVQAIRESDPR